jgi:hypothetical protein
MKPDIVAALYGAILLAITHNVYAQSYFSCNPDSPYAFFRQPLWRCQVCGDYLRGSAPIGCNPQNATVRGHRYSKQNDHCEGPLTD